MNIVSGLFDTLTQQVSKIAYVNPADDDDSEPYEKLVKPSDAENVEGKTTKADTIVNVEQGATAKGHGNAAELPAKAIDVAKSIGSKVLGFATLASQEIAGKAVHVKNTLGDKTILGDFEKEQEKFIEQQTRNHSATAIPPWVGYNEEAVMKKQILALSLDSRNFLRDPPFGIDFHFDFASAFPVALATLEEDPNLAKMRFSLVPKQIKEERFWKNYFYRVSLIKQSTHLTTMTNSGEASTSTATAADSKPTAARNIDSHVKDENYKESLVSSPHEDFLSDQASAEVAAVSDEELQKLRQQLGIESDQAKTLASDREHSEDWERELVAELNEYELVTEQSGKTDAEWEQEISELLQAEDAKTTPTEKSAAE